MPRPRASKSAVEERKAAILSAARQVFGEHGFSDASVDRIAQLAGIAKGTVYLYFPSKESLCEACLRDRIRLLESSLTAAVAAAADTRARLEAFIRTKLEVFAAHRAFLHMYLGEFGPARLPVTEMRQIQLRILERVLRQGRKAGEIRTAAVRLAARLVFDVSHGLVKEQLMSERPTPHTRAIHTAVDLVLGGLAR
jgi:AcrR family transcriptional regulator